MVPGFLSELSEKPLLDVGKAVKQQAGKERSGVLK